MKRKIEESDVPPLTGTYDVIVVDPPWAYGTEYDLMADVLPVHIQK